MTNRTPSSTIRLAVLLIAFTISPLAVADEPPLEELSLEELMMVEVVTASNMSEVLGEAPATVIVVGRNQILDRGYTDLTQLLDDLPGMEMVRPWGATYFKNYWRGYRNTIGDPFLLMVDGIVFNHLYFNTADVIATFPLSNVDRVEIVYGPASAVYGANAFMGVINVITIHETANGTTLRGSIAGGSFDARLADLSFSHKEGSLSLTVTARLSVGELDPSIAGRAEYLSNRYFGNRDLWGGFIDNPDLGGAFRSEHDHQGVDVRARLGSLEAGIQYYRLTSGYGAEYAADRAQNNAIWSRPDFSVFLRDKREIRDTINATTTIRYRKSNVSNDSYFIENATSFGNQPLVDFSYWRSNNDSVSLFEDVEMKLSPSLRLTSGLKFERKNLQKAYETEYGPTLPPSEVDVTTYPFPTPPGGSRLANNEVTTEDIGAYAQLHWLVAPEHRVNLGIRIDDNSRYETATTIRAGYVGSFGHWRVKALYGEAFQEPNNRLLYGGWDGSGSDPTLEPELSRTTELSVGYTKGPISTTVSLFDIHNSDTFVSVEGGARNLGDRDVSGLDIHGRLKLPGIGRVTVDGWGYYSHLFRARERKYDEAAIDTGVGNIGDLAKDKIWLGATADMEGHWSATLRMRWVDDRPTVDTNPIAEIPSFTTTDLTVRLKRLFDTPFGVTLAINNLTDERYAHPGVRDASSGIEPGRFDEEGRWFGSSGFYSSILPQPGRSVTVLMHFEPRLSPGN